MKKLSLIHYLVALAVMLAMIVIGLILLRVPGPIRTALVPPTPGPSPTPSPSQTPTPSPTPTSTPVPDGLLAHVVFPDDYQRPDFSFALEPSGDAPLTEFRALVSYGMNSAAAQQADGETAQVVIGSHILISGNWKHEWEEVKIDLISPDGTVLESNSYYDEVYLGDYGTEPRTRMGFSYDIPVESATGTYSAEVHWDDGTETTFSFDVTQPYAPFVRMLCENNERHNVYLAGFQPGEKVRLAAYGWDNYYNDAGPETTTYALLGDWTVTVGSDGSLFWLFPDLEESYEYELLLASGDSRPVTVTDLAGETLKVSGYDRQTCPEEQP